VERPSVTGTRRDRAFAETAPGRLSWGPPALLALVGAVAVSALAAPAPEAAGARRLVAPEVLLGAFDATWTMLLARPGRRGVAESLVLLVAGLPFHLAVASTTHAADGHLAAVVLAGAAFGVAGAVGARAVRGVHGLGVAVLAFGLPLGAYGLAEFAGAGATGLLAASPLAGPVLLARRAGTCGAADALPALVAALGLLALDLGAGALQRRRDA